MITEINESKTQKSNVNVDLMKENLIQINGGITININVNVKNVMYVKKMVCDPATCNCENGKYLASIMGNFSDYV